MPHAKVEVVFKSGSSGLVLAVLDEAWAPTLLQRSKLGRYYKRRQSVQSSEKFEYRYSYQTFGDMLVKQKRQQVQDDMRLTGKLYQVTAFPSFPGGFFYCLDLRVRSTRDACTEYVHVVGRNVNTRTVCH